jgi:hypothetical protein
MSNFQMGFDLKSIGISLQKSMVDQGKSLNYNFPEIDWDGNSRLNNGCRNYVVITSRSSWNYIEFTDETGEKWKVEVISKRWSTDKWIANVGRQSTVHGIEIGIKLENRKNTKLKSSSKRKIKTEDISAEAISEFIEGRLEKAIQSCRNRREKVNEKIREKQAAVGRKYNRSGNWRSVMRSLKLPKGLKNKPKDTYFHNGECTTMQLIVEPGNDEMIAKVLAAVSGEDYETVLNMFHLANVK